MSRTPLAMHDELLLSAPEGARHDADICPFCADWSLLNSGIPSGFGRLDEAAKKAPYGDVEYADPGLQSDGVKRYPIDTEAHARAAWSYINQEDNAGNYSSGDLSKVRSKISAALKRFGVTVDESADAAPEGGTPRMDSISKETHEALLEKEVRIATEAALAEKAALTDTKAALEAEVASLKEAAATSEAEIASLKEANERLNGELDTAQVAVKTASDEVSALKADIAAKEEEALKSELASARAEQVRNLGLFGEDYVSERAARWADLDEAAWSERLEEWKAAKSSAPAASGKTDTASALSGTNEIPAGEQPTARRAVLGLN